MILDLVVVAIGIAVIYLIIPPAAFVFKEATNSWIKMIKDFRREG
jgi:hypothetical protein